MDPVPTVQHSSEGSRSRFSAQFNHRSSTISYRRRSIPGSIVYGTSPCRIIWGQAINKISPTLDFEGSHQPTLKILVFSKESRKTIVE
ncbi:hypothetical protein M378DRAFT_159466 [Amanita muscaria Koide BX008]|uniref:Uncharacterized protein n=1 Tax=Amanita muscaria (strain Koide BX008) TaxID=946122 RepID=A0A0C2SW25_AMAMK|nr:hypothetical protein M378DRAFT_159466 [Amanita muscaria Koide BX008]